MLFVIIFSIMFDMLFVMPFVILFVILSFTILFIIIRICLLFYIFFGLLFFMLLFFQSELSENDLLAYFAIKQDNRVDAVDIKKEMEKKKNYFVEALMKRGLALCALERLFKFWGDARVGS